MCDRAFESFTAQSGLILSVVITVGALADIDVVRLLFARGASIDAVPVTLIGEEGAGAEGGVSIP
jgi:hypothetical protein